MSFVWGPVERTAPSLQSSTSDEFKCSSIILLFLCVNMGTMLWCPCGGHRITLFLFTFMRVTEIELGSPKLCDKCLDPLSHPARLLDMILRRPCAPIVYSLLSEPGVSSSSSSFSCLFLRFILFNRQVFYLHVCIYTTSVPGGLGGQ